MFFKGSIALTLVVLILSTGVAFATAGNKDARPTETNQEEKESSGAGAGDSRRRRNNSNKLEPRHQGDFDSPSMETHNNQGRWDKDGNLIMSNEIDSQQPAKDNQEQKQRQDFVCGRAQSNKRYKNSQRTKYRPIEIRMPKIIGGDQASPGEFPWTASIKLNEQPICGGSLIDKSWILTAAHCVVGYNPKNLTVRLGAYRIKDLTESHTFETPVSMFIVHEDYSIPRLFSNDIALVKLQEPVEYTDYIIPICLPTEDQLTTSTSSSNVIINDYSSKEHNHYDRGSQIAGDFNELGQNVYYGLPWTTARRFDSIKLSRLPISKELLKEIQSVGSGVMASLSLGLQQEDLVNMANDLTLSRPNEPASGNSGLGDVGTTSADDNSSRGILTSFLNKVIRTSTEDEDAEDDPTKYSGLSGTVVGWGWVRELEEEEGNGGSNKGYSSITLQKVKLPILRNNVCEAWFQSQSKKITLLPSQFCAGFNSGGKDACRGDSGGPMVIEDNSDTGRYKLIGIVSAGIGCARRSLPGLYTRVASFIPWINAQMSRY